MNTIKKYSILLSMFLVAIIAAVYFVSSLNFASANVTSTYPAPLLKSFEDYTFFATSTLALGQSKFSDVYSTSTSATSTNITPWFDSNGRKDAGYFVVAGAKNVQFYFGRGATTTPSLQTIRYTVQGSPDGTNWYDFPKLVLTASTTKTTQLGVFITTSTSTQSASLDLLNDSFYAVRCIAQSQASGVDGKIFCSATATY